MSGAALAAGLDAWQARLGPGLPDLALPTDRPWPERQTYRGTGIDLALGPALTDAAKRLARRAEVSLFMVLLTAYVRALADWCRQTDIVVGTPVANRRAVGLERRLGCFINFLVLRVDLAGPGGGPVDGREAIRRVRDMCVWAYDHQDVPFTALVDRYGADRGGRRPPLFPVLFELANTPGESRLHLPGLALSTLPFDHGTSEFEMNLILRDGPDGLAGWVLYRTDLFDAATVEAFARRYRTAVRDLAGEAPAVGRAGSVTRS